MSSKANINNIEGGVSPLKARQSSRGGRHAGKATATGRRRGGFAKSKGKRGAGGRNVGGYNVQTRFKIRTDNPVFGDAAKPFSFDKDGNMKVKTVKDKDPKADADATATATANTTGQEWVPAEYGYREKTTHIGSWDYSKGNPTYKQAWAKNLEDIVNKYDSFEDYVQDLEDQKSGKKKGPKNYKKPEYKEDGTTKTEMERYLIKEGYFRSTGGSTADATATATASTSAGKFTLRGNPMFRNYGIGGNSKK